MRSLQAKMLLTQGFLLLLNEQLITGKKMIKVTFFFEQLWRELWGAQSRTAYTLTLVFTFHIFRSIQEGTIASQNQTIPLNEAKF